jgi:GNAT superfamily N-acetyltransferase
VEIWGRERVDELAELAAAALPGESLTADELLACCWDDPSVVLATSDGHAAVCASLQPVGEPTTAAVKLVAVHPGSRRQGLGRALLDEIEAWAWEGGAQQVVLGGAVPFYLWPGVDVQALALSCLAEAAGYHDLGVALNMSVPATFRAPCPDGYVVERVLEDPDVVAVEALVAREWPEWTPETAVALAQGSCFAAFDAAGDVEGDAEGDGAGDGAGDVEGVARRAVGFACHSVNRAGWFGPTGTDPARRGAGVGHALLAEVCRDAMVAGYADVEISWIGPMRFYAKAGGAVSRVFRVLGKRRPAPKPA